ncbi:hypothetical protein WDW37_20910 [Bdellovibrionota bacterium FG-1]
MRKNGLGLIFFIVLTLVVAASLLRCGVTTPSSGQAVTGTLNGGKF